MESVIMIVILLVFAIPFFLILRVLWNLGSWLKRKDRVDYYEYSEDISEEN